MKKDEIGYLKTLTKEDWFLFIERVLTNQSLKILNREDTEIQFLIYLNEELLTGGEYQLLEEFHKNLVSYYKELTPGELKNEWIYNLHYVFSKIKPKRNLADILQYQLTSEKLRGQNSGSVSLHSSLLALLADLELSNKDIINFYIYQVDFLKFDLSFGKVSLRYFIKNNDLERYFLTFNQILSRSNGERAAKMLCSSLLELRGYQGSFFEIHSWLSSGKAQTSETSELYKMVTTELANEIDKNFENYYKDLFAKFTMLHVTEKRGLFKPKLIVDTILDLKQLPVHRRAKCNRLLRKYFQQNIKNNKSTRKSINIDNFEGVYYYYVSETKSQQKNEPDTEIIDKIKINKNLFNILTFLKPDSDYDKIYSKFGQSRNKSKTYDSEKILNKLMEGQ